MMFTKLTILSFKPRNSKQNQMAEGSINSASKRYAMVTGANRGIGFEICRQLASNGIMVILTAIDEKSGIEALEKLKNFGLADFIVFHQLDILDPASISCLVEFINSNYGRLDILVNNAGIAGMEINGDILFLKEFIEGDVSVVFDGVEPEAVKPKTIATVIQTFEDAEKCVKTNYYGTKSVTEALIHLLELSDSPRIVTLSSILASLKLLGNEWAKGMLGNAESLREEKIDEVLHEFLKNSEEDSLQENGWPANASAYKVSKAALNAYTRIMAKKYPRFCINSICPGFVRTDMTAFLGPLTVEEGAKNAVRLALLPDGGPSGLVFYKENQVFF